jgi:hypothetical protein
MKQVSIDKITGSIALIVLIWFITGLAASISSGFAGFWGGLPFWIISVTILLMVVFDFWRAVFRKST